MTCQTVEKRWRAHVTSALRGGDFTFQRAVKKYGQEWFAVETLYECETAKEAALCERGAIAAHNTYITSGGGFNLTIGGDGCAMDPAHQRKMIDAYNAMGRPRSPAGRAAIAERCREMGRKPKTEEVKRKISARLTGTKLSPKRAREAAEHLAKFRGLPKSDGAREKYKEYWNRPEIISQRRALMSSPEVRANKCAAMKMVCENLSDERRKQMSDTITAVNKDPMVKYRKWCEREYQKAMAARIGYPRAYMWRKDRGTTKTPRTEETKALIRRSKRCNKMWKQAMLDRRAHVPHA